MGKQGLKRRRSLGILILEMRTQVGSKSIRSLRIIQRPRKALGVTRTWGPYP